MSEEIVKQTAAELEDGRKDVFFSMNGHRLVVMPQEGYSALGWSYEDAKKFMTGFSDLLAAAITMLAPPSNKTT